MKQKPSNAFIAASWICLLAGTVSYCVGLWNATMQLNEKGYYFVVLMYGLFSAVSLQKAVRDQLEGIRVTAIYYGISWFSTGLSLLLLIVGLSNATLARSEKGFYACRSCCVYLPPLPYKKIYVMPNFPKGQKHSKKLSNDMV